MRGMVHGDSVAREPVPLARNLIERSVERNLGAKEAHADLFQIEQIVVAHPNAHPVRDLDVRRVHLFDYLARLGRGGGPSQRHRPRGRRQFHDIPSAWFHMPLPCQNTIRTPN